MQLTFPGIFKLHNAGTSPQLNLRKLLPHSLKLAYRTAQRQLLDFKTGMRFIFAKPSHSPKAMPCVFELSQPVIANAWLENKTHNFRLAAAAINTVTIQSGQVFSFWKTIGNPTQGRGYKKGRNIVAGRVSETYGGGLCQLSGIIYHTSLLAGLAIVERHNHSVDLYANGETRFTPLGADATVAFGYKDLRVKNPCDFAVRFELEVREKTLTCRLRSEQPIVPLDIVFEVATVANTTVVKTLLRTNNDGVVPIAQSTYRVDN